LHDNKDTKEENELRSFCSFLIACLKNKKLCFPLDIYKGESPDFLLKINPKLIIGLEHTTATVEKYKMDVSESEKYPPGTLIELPYYSGNSSPPKKSSIAVKKPGEKLTHCGWGDDGIEKQWSDIILKTLIDKIELLNKLHFKKFSKNELLIDDDSPSPVSITYRLQSSIDMLKNKYSAIKFEKFVLYDKYHILMGCNLIYDVFGKTIILENKT